ncbi:helix-turn-helix domain-containing protein [Cloacibacterium normanense]
MDVNEISFENLPKAVAHLTNEIAEIKSMVQNAKISEPKEKRIPIGIEDVCKIIGKAKPTIYTLVRERKIPCYKSGKKLYFLKMNFWNGFLKARKNFTGNRIRSSEIS